MRTVGSVYHHGLQNYCTHRFHGLDMVLYSTTDNLHPRTVLTFLLLFHDPLIRYRISTLTCCRLFELLRSA